MLKITLRLSEINYKSIGNKFSDISKNSENNSLLKRLLSRIGFLAVKKLPSDLIEAILVKVINAESRTICSALTKLAKENGIELSVSNISVTK